MNASTRTECKWLGSTQLDNENCLEFVWVSISNPPAVGSIFSVNMEPRQSYALEEVDSGLSYEDTLSQVIPSPLIYSELDKLCKHVRQQAFFVCRYCPIMDTMIPKILTVSLMTPSTTLMLRKLSKLFGIVVLINFHF